MNDALSDFQAEHPERFLFGASVAPFAKSLDYPEEEWEADFQKMKELNITAVRCYVAWDRVEQKEGELDFHAYDHLCDLGVKYGIGIILNLGGVSIFSAPYYKLRIFVLIELSQTLVNTQL